jgi:outer membrane usher protein
MRGSWTLLLLLLAGLAQAQESPTPPLEEVVSAVTINGQNLEESIVVLRDAAGVIWILAEDFAQMRLESPSVPSLLIEGRNYLPVTALPDSYWRFETTTSTLIIDAASRSFQGQALRAADRVGSKLDEVASGAFLNYLLSGENVESRLTSGASLELGVFSRLGVLTSTQVIRRQGREATQNLRLDTTLQRDFPDRLQTLMLGDAISDGGSWGTSLRFAGVRFARNFAIRPDLVTTPMLTALGSAVVPSSVDVFVNGQQVVNEQSVEPGPFSIANLPGIAGAGQINVVVRDALGAEQVITQPFYSSSTLLAKGLHQYAFSIGKIRKDYAFSSFDYGTLLGSASYRRGLSDRHTLETHAEWVSGVATAAGVELVSQLGNLGVASLRLAAGGGQGRSGWLKGIGIERQSSQWSFSLATLQADRGFRRAADVEASSFRERSRWVGQVGMNMRRVGTVSMVVAQRSFFGDAPTTESFGLTHTKQLGRRGSLATSITRTLGAQGGTYGSLTYSASLGTRHSLESSIESRDLGTGEREEEMRVTASKAVPVGTGSGWRVAATQAGSYDVAWQQRLSALEVEAQVAKNFGRAGQGLRVRGALSMLGREVRAARTIEGSFALVDIDGIPNIPVYVDNQLVTKTNARGRALLHNLQAYEVNRISIEADDLPLNTEIRSRTVAINPAYRSGVIARFAIRQIKPATFRLVLEDNQPVRSGALVKMNGEEFGVALDGLTYITNLGEEKNGVVEWTGGSCTFELPELPVDEDLPDLGDILCQQVIEPSP